MTTDPITRSVAGGVADLRRELPGLTGRARGAVDNAESATSHTARQIVYALSQYAADNPDLRSLLRELAAESERLSGAAVRLHSRCIDGTIAISSLEVASRDELLEATLELGAVADDAEVVRASAEAVRRRLPRAYGDPLKLDRDWSAGEES